MKSRIDSLIAQLEETNQIVGTSCMVLKGEEVKYKNSFGFADREKGTKMSSDTICRLFSLSKPITAFAVMILIDRGEIKYDDAVSKYIKSFGKLNFVNEKDEIEECKKEMKICDLMNMTSGIPYADNWGKSPKGTAKLWDELIERQGTDNEMSTAELCERASEIPLAFEPGKTWMYGISADILAGVVEKVSGMKYSEFLKKNIFVPLEMQDTDFYVPEEKLSRFSALYNWRENGLERDDNNYLGLTNYKRPPSFESGGAGLVSTIEDYSKFATMISNNGVYKGVRLISEETFKFMITPQLNSEQLKGMWDNLKGYSYGNLMRNLYAPELADMSTSSGEVGWDGWVGTYFCSDIKNRVTVLYFIQIAGAGTSAVVRPIVKAVYEALNQNNEIKQ